MVSATTLAAVVASQGARRAVATAGGGIVAQRAAGAATKRFVESGRLEEIAEDITGQSLSAGDVPGASGLSDLGDLL